MILTHITLIYMTLKSDREFEGTGNWISNAYVHKSNYTDLCGSTENFGIDKDDRGCVPQDGGQWTLIGDIIQERWKE